MTQTGFGHIGFIGLGVMGEAMCRNLVRRGTWAVTAFDLNPAPLERLAGEGAGIAGSVAELMAQVDLVITCLPGGEQVRALVLGADGLVGHLREGQVLIDMSTSQPTLMREIAAEAAEKGARFADAPIARTRQAAADGTLAIMVGAPDDLFQTIRPVLATMGSDIEHCGAVGSGQVIKIMNNMVLFQTVLALGQAVAIAEKAGVPGKVLLDTMMKGSGDSFALRNHGVKAILADTYPEKSFSVRYAAKDLSYALEMAAEFGVRAPGGETVARMFEEAIANGDGDRYFPVMRRILDVTDA
ncbi:MAG: NAD(P)-dependent oxidoreductase [Minwuia sp.]|nr:NAD(P)-dependent oxidoreductase [Minwuia sp.]